MTYFVHLSNFKKYNTIHDVSYIHPDIIGWNRRYITKYYVWECKGTRDALPGGKNQANAIQVINSRAVERNIVSAVYPTKKLGKIRAQVKDPTMEGAEIDFDKRFRNLLFASYSIIKIFAFAIYRKWNVILQNHFRKQRIYFWFGTRYL